MTKEGPSNNVVLHKSALKLHCPRCGDTLFLEKTGQSFCFGCNERWKILVGGSVYKLVFETEEVAPGENLLKGFLEMENKS